MIDKYFIEQKKVLNYRIGNCIYPVIPCLGLYDAMGGKRLYVALLDVEAIENDDPDFLFSDITINLVTYPLAKDYAFLCSDLNGFSSWLVENGFGKVADSRVYPYVLFHFDESKLREIDAATYEEYVQNFA